MRVRFYPWLMVGSGLILLTLCNGIINSSISVFDEPLLKEFGWQRGDLKFREFVTSVVAAALIFFSGSLIDRFGAKRMMMLGMVLLAIGLGLYSLITSRYQMYALHILLAAALVSAGTISTIVLVSSWFKSHRGLALGITLMGTSMGGVVFPKPVTALIAQYGWRTTIQFMALLPLCFFVWILFLVYNRPDLLGMRPVGQEINDKPAENLLLTGLSYREATRTVLFWLIGISGFFTFYSMVGMLSNTFLYMRELGYEPTQAASALSLFALLSLTGKLTISSLSDYFNPYRVFAFCCIGMFIGSLGYSLMNKEVIWYTLPFMALCWGGMYTLYNLISVKSFGLKAIGKINGTISILESIGAALGPWLTGVLYDANGSYQMGFMVINGLLFLAVIIAFWFNKSMFKN
ncbi:MAG: MFS transporter [Runella sp.]